MVNNKNFIQIPTHGSGLKYVSITSIALIDQIGTKTVVTLKEKDANGNNITFEAALPYSDLTAAINQLVEKS